MLTKKQKFIFFITSYIPMWLIFFIKVFIAYKENNCYKFIILTIIFILIIPSICCLKNILNCKSCASSPIFITSVKNIPIDYITNYFSLYLFPFFALEIENNINLIILFIIMILSAYLYVKNNIIYINPILNFLGYSIYEVEIKLNSNTENKTQSSYLITKREIYEVPDKLLKIYKFEHNIYLEKKEDISKNNEK